MEYETTIPCKRIYAAVIFCCSLITLRFTNECRFSGRLHVLVFSSASSSLGIASEDLFANGLGEFVRFVILGM